MADDELHLDEDEARIAALLRSIEAGDLELETPPPSVWAGIEAALADDSDAASTADEQPAPVISLSKRRRPAFVAAAVAAAVIVIAGVVVAVTGGDDGPVEVASAELVYIPDDPGFVPEGVGRRAVVTLLRDDGKEIVRFDDSDLPEPGPDTDLEAWLIGVRNGEIAIVLPIGLVEDPEEPGTFIVPDDFDRSAYDAVAVDISIEPHDGDPAHSGMSLVRGPLVEV